MKKLISTLLLLIICIISAFAQPNAEMADEMRSNGKIYVVVAVVLTIFLGIIIYLIRIDRKLTKLENQSPTE